MRSMRTILVIEDDDSTRLFIQRLLRKHGYWALGASTGQEGIHLALTLQPELILCDILMPEVNGYDVFEALQGSKLTRDTPFIFLTAKTLKRDTYYGICLGADDYLPKPVDPEQLIAAIDARLSSLDLTQPAPHDDPQPFGTPSVEWFEQQLITPSLQARYRGWYMAIEPESGRCFLGKDAYEAHRSAAKALPNKVFIQLQI